MHDRKKAGTYLYFSFNLAARWGWVAKAALRAYYCRERVPVPR